MGKKSISSEIKQHVVGLHLGGFDSSEIARTLKSVSRSCVLRTILKFEKTGTTADKNRPGRPRIASITDDNTSIYRVARKNHKYSAKEIVQEVNLALKNHISRQTVNRRLIDRKLCCYVAARKPLLKPTVLLKCIKFCRAILKMTNYELRRIIFSDESNFTVINRKNRVIIRRHYNEMFHSRYIMSRLQGGGGLVGIWGCIAYDGPGLCYLYNGRMGQHKYIEMLENHLIPTRDIFFSNESEWEFQQDNAPCHKAKTVTTWFQENNIKVLQWPARSPDLNPIENAWSVLDRKLTKAPVTSAAHLRESLKELFDSLSTDYCRKLFDLIKRRCELCIKNKGGHIPY